MRKTFFPSAALVLILAVGNPGRVEAAPDQEFRQAKDLKTDFKEDDAAVFSMPVALSLIADSLFIVDAQDGAIKVFSKEGRYLRDIGRQGKGPGEFDFPSSLAGRDEKIYVADTFNYRVQILDAQGRYLGGIKLAQAPQQVLIPEKGRIVVYHRPGPIPAKEKLIRCYDEKGTLLWEAMDAQRSSDSTYDLFRNDLILMDGGDGTFFVAKKCDDRTLYHYDGAGRLIGRIEAVPVRSPKTISIPLRSGPRDLTPVHWDCHFYGGRFYILRPEFCEDRDIGPGRILSVLDGAGRMLEEIGLPDPVKKIRVEEDRIYAFDTENALRIFQVFR